MNVNYSHQAIPARFACLRFILLVEESIRAVKSIFPDIINFEICFIYIADIYSKVF